MNKEITIYELLGLIIDDKEPKKIKYRDLEYKYSYKYKDYENVKEKLLFADVCAIKTSLNDKVEILEEDEDIEEIELLEEKNKNGNKKYYLFAFGNKYSIRIVDVYLAAKLNEVIREVNKLKDKDR